MTIQEILDNNIECEVELVGGIANVVKVGDITSASFCDASSCIKLQIVDYRETLQMWDRLKVRGKVRKQIDTLVLIGEEITRLEV